MKKGRIIKGLNLGIFILLLVFHRTIKMEILGVSLGYPKEKSSIKVPQKTKPKLIVVRKGYCLSRIATELSTEMQRIVLDNQIENPNLVQPGQELIVFPYTKKNTATVSWYGKNFHGKKMSNGDTYDMYDPTTVAHKLLPFGTKVRLTSPLTRKSVIVTVKDRGPYIDGRHFDLSMAAAEKLGIKVMGCAECQVEILN